MPPRLSYSLIAFVLSSAAATADERQIIARTFHSDPQYVVMNLPPRPDTWPGAIFTANLRLPLVHGDPKDPALHKGPPIGITTKEGFDLAGSAQGGLSAFFGVSAKAGDAANVVLSFPDARIVDMDQSDLIKHVLSSSSAIDDARRGHIPILVIKAYTGTPTITITKKNNASADAWAKAKVDISVGVAASAESDNEVVYKGTQEIIFAFETSEVHFDPTDLNNGKYNIQLSSLPEETYAFRQDDNDQKLANVIKATTGVSAADIEARGIAGGPSSVFRHGRLDCILGMSGC